MELPAYALTTAAVGGEPSLGTQGPQTCPCGCAMTLSTKFMEQYTKLETQLLLLQKYVLELDARVKRMEIRSLDARTVSQSAAHLFSPVHDFHRDLVTADRAASVASHHGDHHLRPSEVLALAPLPVSTPTPSHASTHKSDSGNPGARNQVLHPEDVIRAGDLTPSHAPAASTPPSHYHGHHGLHGIHMDGSHSSGNATGGSHSSTAQYNTPAHSVGGPSPSSASGGGVLPLVVQSPPQVNSHHHHHHHHPHHSGRASSNASSPQPSMQILDRATHLPESMTNSRSPTVVSGSAAAAAAAAAAATENRPRRALKRSTAISVQAQQLQHLQQQQHQQPEHQTSEENHQSIPNSLQQIEGRMETTGLLQESVERIQQALLQNYLPGGGASHPQQQQQPQTISVQASPGANGQQLQGLVTQIHPIVGGNLTSLPGGLVSSSMLTSTSSTSENPNNPTSFIACIPHEALLGIASSELNAQQFIKAESSGGYLRVTVPTSSQMAAMAAAVNSQNATSAASSATVHHPGTTVVSLGSLAPTSQMATFTMASATGHGTNAANVNLVHPNPSSSPTVTQGKLDLGRLDAKLMSTLVHHGAATSGSASDSHVSGQQFVLTSGAPGEPPQVTTLEAVASRVGSKTATIALAPPPPPLHMAPTPALVPYVASGSVAADAGAAVGSTGNASSASSSGGAATAAVLSPDAHAAVAATGGALVVYQTNASVAGGALVVTSSSNDSEATSTASGAGRKTTTNSSGAANPKDHICRQCGRGFSQKGDLRRHMLIHSGHKPHKCSECGKAFTHKVTLKRHLLTHTGERPHICKECTKAFSQKGDLTRHMLTHSGQKPHVCSVCQKGFSQKGDLTRHMLTHSGERSHVCQECGRAFAHKETLKKHAATHAQQNAAIGAPSTSGANLVLNAAGPIERTVVKAEKNICEECNIAFASRTDLLRHRSVLHPPSSSSSSHYAIISGSASPAAHQLNNASTSNSTVSHSKTAAAVVAAAVQQQHLQQLQKYEVIHGGIPSPSASSSSGGTPHAPHGAAHHVSNSAHAQQVHTCMDCGKSFSLAKYLTSHMLTHAAAGSGHHPSKSGSRNADGGSSSSTPSPLFVGAGGGGGNISSGSATPTGNGTHVATPEGINHVSVDT